MIFSLRASASFLLPEMTRHQSSAYVDRRIMPTGLLEAQVGGLGGLCLVGIISVMI